MLVKSPASCLGAAAGGGGSTGLVLGALPRGGAGKEDVLPEGCGGAWNMRVKSPGSCLGAAAGGGGGFRFPGIGNISVGSPVAVGF